MATVINNPGQETSSGMAWGIALVVIVLVALALLFGIPAIRTASGGSTTNITVPAPTTNVGGNAGAPAGGYSSGSAGASSGY
jgi:hypothetical protein